MAVNTFNSLTIKTVVRDTYGGYGSPAGTMAYMGLLRGAYRQILAGSLHTNCGERSTIHQGLCNYISPTPGGDTRYASIGNGYKNFINSTLACLFGSQNTIVNGNGNIAGPSTSNSFIGNGSFNQVQNFHSTIVNGGRNISGGCYSLVLNGQVNIANGNTSVVISGTNNSAFGKASIIGNGFNQAIDSNSSHSGILIGACNTISGSTATGGSNCSAILGGYCNIIGINNCNVFSSSISNGCCNKLLGAVGGSSNSSIVGGSNNCVIGSW
jgi:hypothetical protein